MALRENNTLGREAMGQNYIAHRIRLEYDPVLRLLSHTAIKMRTFLFFFNLIEPVTCLISHSVFKITQMVSTSATLSQLKLNYLYYMHIYTIIPSD